MKNKFSICFSFSLFRIAVILLSFTFIHFLADAIQSDLQLLYMSGVAHLWSN